MKNKMETFYISVERRKVVNISCNLLPLVDSYNPREFAVKGPGCGKVGAIEYDKIGEFQCCMPLKAISDGEGRPFASEAGW